MYRYFSNPTACHSLGLLSVLLSLGFVRVAAESTYYSRPEIIPPNVTVTTYEDGEVTDGYIFMAPYDIDQSAPYIFDSTGELVWSGYGHASTADAQDFQMVTMNNETRLVFFIGTEVNGFGRGHGLILDSAYNTLGGVKSGNGKASIDMHEYHVVENGETALVSIYQLVPYDLSDYGITGGLGWIVSGTFQEVNITSGEVLFEWSSIDHVGLEASFKAIGSMGGSSTEAYDYFHLNAVDKDSSGNYWISSRHTSCLYYLNGTTGDVIYRINGINSSFTVSSDAQFSSQHHLRIVNSSDSTLMMSLFDNASDGTNTTASNSRGMLINVDTDAMTVDLLQEYVSPEKLLCSSQGSVQVLGNGNVFVGWGKKPAVSEFAADGTAVFDMNWDETGGMNYRAFKYNFTAEPDDVPAVWSYSGDDSTVVYTSWNGATKAKYWNIYGGSSTANVSLVATTSKSGFETNVTLSETYAYIVAEALDSSKAQLANSSSFKTFDASQVLSDSSTETVLMSADTIATSSSTADSAAAVARPSRLGFAVFVASVVMMVCQC